MSTAIAPAEHDEHQAFERDWWGDCTTSFGEETKQLTYAYRMGLRMSPWGGHWPVYDVGGASIVDLGGGPVSMLLKCVRLGRGVVVDPCRYPAWTDARYDAKGISVVRLAAEEYEPAERFDEAWIYNVLQHVEDPERVIATARRIADRVRIFEWIEMPPTIGHPHTLTADELERWLGAGGTVADVDENGAVGRAFYGVFPA